MSRREDRERPAYPGWIKLLEAKTEELKEFFKSPMPFTAHAYPFLKDVADIAAHVPYNYDTVYKVWLEWDNDIEVTKSIFMMSLGSSVNPLDITKDRMDYIIDGMV